jgi:DNA-binding CsgD family transcriptional regulator
LHNLFSLVYAPQRARRSRLAAALSACGLTEREGEVVLLFYDRLSAGEIAERLKISRRTVEKHIEHVYLKLQVHNRRGLREETILGDAVATALERRRA